jgi:hypothetical protein
MFDFVAHPFKENIDMEYAYDLCFHLIKPYAYPYPNERTLLHNRSLLLAQLAYSNRLIISYTNSGVIGPCHGCTSEKCKIIYSAECALSIEWLNFIGLYPLYKYFEDNADNESIKDVIIDSANNELVIHLGFGEHCGARLYLLCKLFRYINALDLFQKHGNNNVITTTTSNLMLVKALDAIGTLVNYMGICLNENKSTFSDLCN